MSWPEPRFGAVRTTGFRPDPSARWEGPLETPAPPVKKRRRLGVIGWLIVVLFAPAVPILAYRFAPPPATPLMALRSVEGEGMRYDWVPASRIAPTLSRAVIASEDQKFCTHGGFDWDELGQSWRDHQVGRPLRGASTITQQTAKNLFLWPGRSYLRKGLEAWLTVWLELLWPKSRILETYLNIVEWGPGVYGAEAAAQTYFRKAAAALTADEAALLAAVLPNPRKLSAAAPSAYVSERAAVIRGRAGPMTIPGPRCP